jgi:hypothetical protein
VFTVEGVYSIQVSPCKIKLLKNMESDQLRGTLIFLIEEYFKCTHNFRCVDEVNAIQFITPYTFVDFINNFSFSANGNSNFEI